MNASPMQKGMPASTIEERTCFGRLSRSKTAFATGAGHNHERPKSYLASVLYKPLAPLVTSRRPDPVEFTQVLEALDASARFFPAESQSLGIEAAAATWAANSDTTTSPIGSASVPSGAQLVQRYHADAGKVTDDAHDPASFVPTDDDTVDQSDAVSESELMALRRRLARRHHPDLFPPEHKDEASRQMALANATIDKRLRALKHA
jgi:hypothetical protein